MRFLDYIVLPLHCNVPQGVVGRPLEDDDSAMNLSVVPAPACKSSSATSGSADERSLFDLYIQDRTFFRIVCNNLPNHTFIGDLSSLREVELMAQIYRVVDAQYDSEQRKASFVTVVPVPAADPSSGHLLVLRQSCRIGKIVVCVCWLWVCLWVCTCVYVSVCVNIDISNIRSTTMYCKCCCWWLLLLL